MCNLKSTESSFSGPDVALAQSALQLARAAIARWSGSETATAPMRELPRVSPQARWLADAQCGLAAWIAGGGFAQDDAAAPLSTPVLYQLPTHFSAADARSDACID